MKFIIVFAALFAIALAAPPRPEETVVLRSETDVRPQSFHYTYALSDGSETHAHGDLKNVGKEDEAFVIKGGFAFVSDDGETYAVNYIADENGYQPQGAHLPVGPEA